MRAPEYALNYRIEKRGTKEFWTWDFRRTGYRDLAARIRELRTPPEDYEKILFISYYADLRIFCARNIYLYFVIMREQRPFRKKERKNGTHRDEMRRETVEKAAIQRAIARGSFTSFALFIRRIYQKASVSYIRRAYGRYRRADLYFSRSVRRYHFSRFFFFPHKYFRTPFIGIQ